MALSVLRPTSVIQKRASADRLRLGADVFLYSIQPELNDMFLMLRNILQQTYENRYGSHAEVDLFTNNEEAIFDRMITYTNILIECVRKATGMNLEDFHKEWIESITVNALYCIVPNNEVVRRNIANKYGIEAINKWAFAYWPRRTGKSYNTAMPIVAFLFSIPGGNAALQSVHKNSAWQTMQPFRMHIANLFEFMNVDKRFDPILSFNSEGMRFVNWYGAQELLSGKYNSNQSLPPHCYGRVIIISGNSNSARGITVHVYICDEERFVREHAKINLIMGTKRAGTIFVAMSSQDPEDHNVTVENLQSLTDIVSLSVYETRCPDCRKAEIDECPHRGNPEWIVDIGPFEKVTNAIVHESGKNILSTELNNYKASFTEAAFSVPKKDSIADWRITYLPSIAFLIVSIDPALNMGGGSKFASTIMGASKPDTMTPGLSSFIVSFLECSFYVGCHATVHQTTDTKTSCSRWRSVGLRSAIP